MKKKGLLAGLAAMAVLQAGLSGQAMAQELTTGFLSWMQAVPNGDLDPGHVEVLNGVYGASPMEVSVQDFDGDGDPEYIVRHLANCQVVDGHEARGVIAVCPWSVIDRRDGMMMEVLAESGWRARALIREGQVVGLSLDGQKWTASPEWPGHMLPIGDAVVWTDVRETELLAGIEARFGTVHDFYVTTLDIAGREVVLAHDRGGGERAFWAVIYDDNILHAGEVQGRPVPSISRLGLLRLNDSETGLELSRVSFPLTEGGWWFLWARPEMPPGWAPIEAREVRNPAEDPDGLWTAAELRMSEEETSSIWRSAMVLPDGQRLVLSWLVNRCGARDCALRGKLETRAGAQRVSFDGEWTSRSCVADPQAMALTMSGRLRLWACGRTMELAAGG